jgi:hypothetical protein
MGGAPVVISIGFKGDFEQDASKIQAASDKLQATRKKGPKIQGKDNKEGFKDPRGRGFKGRA